MLRKLIKDFLKDIKIFLLLNRVKIVFKYFKYSSAVSEIIIILLIKI